MSANSTLVLTLELMNENRQPRETVLTVEYEYLATIPADFTKLDSWWLDVGDCKSDVPVPASQTVFNLTAPSWTAPSDGTIVFTAGHVHDGGTLLKARRNNSTLCDYIPTYGGAPGFVQQMSGDMAPITHISSMSTCTNAGGFKSGDTFDLHAEYDISSHAAMHGSHGALEPVMGIAIAFVKGG